jgi:xanthine dehydrogenase small subunit
MSQRPIRFVHRGRIVQVEGLHPATSALSWLREHAGCTGTKEGCNEGDCGACTVLVGELAAGEPRWRPINSCIAFLPALDGKALLTVEDLGGSHPAQRAMVECHGSQCGFCTPGFVMSLAACLDRHRHAGTTPTRQELADELSGNLCRCTGYRTILDAGERMATLAPQPLATPALRELLAHLQADPPLDYEGSGGRVVAPRTVDALAQALAQRPQARILAGSTDIGLWVNKQLQRIDELVCVGGVAALGLIVEADGCLRIGAAASLAAAWDALARHWPAAREMGLRFASRPVREAGTMGGNLANGSPIGDAAPVLMALAATLVLRRGEATRRLALADFYTGYMTNRLVPGEFVQAIEVPLATRAAVRAYKISKRFDCDISALCAGLAIERDRAGTIVAARLAFGGMAATVRRAAQGEAALVGEPWNEATLAAAQSALGRDFAPLSDLRASAAYRLQVAQNLLRRFWLETRGDAPLGAGQASVWGDVRRSALAAPP